jgi:hypothetical protein
MQISRGRNLSKFIVTGGVMNNNSHSGRIIYSLNKRDTLSLRTWILVRLLFFYGCIFGIRELFGTVVAFVYACAVLAVFGGVHVYFRRRELTMQKVSEEFVLLVSGVALIVLACLWMFLENQGLMKASDETVPILCIAVPSLISFSLLAYAACKAREIGRRFGWKTEFEIPEKTLPAMTVIIFLVPLEQRSRH